MTYTYKTLGEVAEVFDERRGSFPGSMRPLRKGPYLLYLGNSTVPFDDFTFDGTYLLLGTAGNVAGPSRCFNAALVEGKFAVGETYHVVACEDPLDTAYLGWALTYTPVRGFTETKGESVRLSDEALRRIQVPWPEAATRHAFVRFMYDQTDLVERRRLESRALFEQTCADYVAKVPRETFLGKVCEIRRGRPLAPEARTKEGRLPVVCAQGVVARTDEPCEEEPCVVVVQVGVRLNGYRMPEGAFPLEDAVAVTPAPHVPMTVDELTLALGALGARSYTNMVDGKPDTLKAKLAELHNVKIAVPEGELDEELAMWAHESLEQVDALERESQEIERNRTQLASDLVACAPDVPERLAAWEVEEGPVAVAEAPEVARDVMEDAADICLCELADVLAQMEGAVAESKTPRSDAARELMPLLFVRCLPDVQVWERVMAAQDPLAQVDAELERVAGESPALEALTGLTSASASLPADARLAALAALDALPDAQACGLGAGDLVRWLAREGVTESVKKQKDFVEERRDAPCPPSVSLLFGQVVSAFAPNATDVLDPCASSGEALAACKRALPQIACHAQTERPDDALAAAMAAHCEGWDYAEGAPQVAFMLTDDRFEGRRFDVVASMLPSNPGMWWRTKLDDDDPRWLQFGFPPRSRANFAWLEQSYIHRAEGGYVVLLASDALLHESRGEEAVTRRTLIESGCVRAAITLPGGIYDDDRAPACILVLGDRREGEENAQAETLLVDAMELGTPRVATTWPTHRSLPLATVDRVAAVVRAWAQDGTIEAQPGFARSVPRSELAEVGDLTPWAFV